MLKLGDVLQGVPGAVVKTDQNLALPLPNSMSLEYGASVFLSIKEESDVDLPGLEIIEVQS